MFQFKIINCTLLSNRKTSQVTSNFKLNSCYYSFWILSENFNKLMLEKHSDTTWRNTAAIQAWGFGSSCFFKSSLAVCMVTCQHRKGKDILWDGHTTLATSVVLYEHTQSLGEDESSKHDCLFSMPPTSVDTTVQAKECEIHHWWIFLHWKGPFFNTAVLILTYYLQSSVEAHHSHCILIAPLYKGFY